MKFTYQEVEDIITRYTNGENVFDDFEFTRAFMNKIRMFKDDDFVAAAFYRYAIDVDSNNRQSAYPIARMCEIFEETTNGASFIKEIHESTREYDTVYVTVVQHIPSGLYMKHECFEGSYGNGYATEDSTWVQVFPKERIVIDYVE